jgi:5-methylcytosine-specific restriction enzyme A
LPKKPESPCRFNGCPELTHDSYCEKHQSIIDHRYNKYERDPQTYKRYSNRWRKIRRLYIQEHPMCELCERKNLLVPVQEVHHIVPLSQGGTHREENLMGLCKSCHSRITATEGGRWG